MSPCATPFIASVITTAGLRTLGLSGQAGRFRANLLLDAPGDGFPEDGWLGRTLHVGKRMATAEGRLEDLSGKLYAHATTTCIVLNGG